MEFKAVSTVYDNQGNVAYKFTGADKKEIYVPEKDIVNFLNNPENMTDLEVAKTKNGSLVEIKSSLTAEPLPKVSGDIPKPLAKRISLFQGEELAKGLKANKKNRLVRTEVTIADYLRNPTNTACSVCGIRYTGKRDLVEHEVAKSGLVDSTVWVRVNSNNVKHYELLFKLEEHIKNKETKLIVIENADRIDDLHLAAWLADKVSSGLKAVFIMPGDIFLKRATYSVFRSKIHSVYMTEVTFSEYRAVNKQHNISFSDYVKMGTLKFSGVPHTNFSNAFQHADIADDYNVVADVASTIAPNQEALKWFSKHMGLKDAATEIMQEVYKLIISIIGSEYGRLDNSSGCVNIRESATWVKSTSRGYLEKMFKSGIVKSVGVPERFFGNGILRESVISSLIEMGILFRVVNNHKYNHKANSKNEVNPKDGKPLPDSPEYNLYFTAPSIVNRLTEQETRVLNTGYLPLEPKSTDSTRYGYIFESAVVHNVYKILDRKQDKKVGMYFYRDGLNREIDMVLINGGKNDAGIRESALYEIKSNDSMDRIKKSKPKWIGKKFMEDFMNTIAGAQIADRAILYPGESNRKGTILNEDSPLPVKFINIDEFMTNLEKV